MIEQYIRSRISELDKLDKDAQHRGDLSESTKLSAVKCELHDLIVVVNKQERITESLNDLKIPLS